ncbi:MULTISPECIES: hypothetical protein [unclassified Moorena]|nr:MULTISPECIES: hypothetical protein [unclassified Moorena]
MKFNPCLSFSESYQRTAISATRTLREQRTAISATRTLHRTAKG